MKPFLPAVLAITALVPAAFLAACGGDDAEDDAAPIVLQQSDRDRITQMSTDYLRALAARDMAAAKAQLPAGVPDQTVTNAMNTVRDEGLTFQRVGGWIVYPATFMPDQLPSTTADAPACRRARR